MWTDTIIKFRQLMLLSRPLPLLPVTGAHPFRQVWPAYEIISVISLELNRTSGHRWTVSMDLYETLAIAPLIIRPHVPTTYALMPNGLVTEVISGPDFRVLPFSAYWLHDARALHNAFVSANLQAPHLRLTMLTLTTIHLLRIGATPQLDHDPTAAVLAAVRSFHPRLGENSPLHALPPDLMQGIGTMVAGDRRMRALHNLLLTDEEVGIDRFVSEFAASAGLPTGGFTPDPQP